MMMWFSAFFIAARIVECSSRCWAGLTAALSLSIVFYLIKSRQRDLHFISSWPCTGFEIVKPFIICSAGIIIFSVPIASPEGASSSSLVPTYAASRTAAETANDESPKGHKGISGWIQAVKEVPGTMHSAMAESFERPRLTGKSRAFLNALILADREGIGWRLSESYSFLGIAHFLALSGLHLGIISVFVVGLAGFLPLKPSLKDLFVVIVLSFYSAAAGNPHSLLRALALLAAGMVYRAVGVRSTMIQSLTVGAFVLVTFDISIYYSIGFRLSFMAVAGIALIGMPCIRFLERHLPVGPVWKPLKAAVSSVLITVSVQLLTTPITIEAFGRSPLFSTAANIVMMLPVTLFLSAGVVYCIVPIEIVREILVYPLNAIAEVLFRIPSAMSFLPDAAVYRGDICYPIYSAGLILVLLSLSRRGQRKRAAAVLGIILIAASYPAARCLVKPEDGICREFSRQDGVSRRGVRYLAVGEGLLVLERGINGPYAVSVTRELWKSGIRKCAIVAVLGAGRTDFEPICLLAKRMKADSLILNPYIGRPGKAESKSLQSAGCEVVLLTEPLYISAGASRIVFGPPEFPPARGKRFDPSQIPVRFEVLGR